MPLGNIYKYAYKLFNQFSVWNIKLGINIESQHGTIQKLAYCSPLQEEHSLKNICEVLSTLLSTLRAGQTPIYTVLLLDTALIMAQSISLLTAHCPNPNSFPLSTGQNTNSINRYPKHKNQATLCPHKLLLLQNSGDIYPPSRWICYYMKVPLNYDCLTKTDT